MALFRISAFSDGETGGNPAGVVLAKAFPSEVDMQRIAAEVGYSETAFAVPADGGEGYRVRYFSPETEVPFCGHATIALGAVLAEQVGEGSYALQLNDARISVDGWQESGAYRAALRSPETFSRPLDPGLLDGVLDLFSLSADAFDTDIPPAFIHGGANHVVIVLKDRSRLAQMDYSLEAGRRFMRTNDLVTIMLAWRETDTLFHVRNAFASGGVLEDPATGAAAAAFSGYLRDLGWLDGGALDIVQGEDMGSKSLIHTEFSGTRSEPVKVSGRTRKLAV